MVPTEIIGNLHDCGAFLVAGKSGFTHTIGGPSDTNIPICKNCQLPYVVFLTLDLRDPIISGSWNGNSRVPLIYCPRCSVFGAPLVYGVNSNGHITIIEADKGAEDGLAESWELTFPGGIIPAQKCTLVRYSPSVQAILDKANNGQRPDMNDARLMESYLGRVVAPNAYFALWVYNQIGGRGFLPQSFDPLLCPNCRKVKTTFLASLANDSFQGIKLLWGDLYLEYWYCELCRCVVAQQFCT